MQRHDDGADVGGRSAVGRWDHPAGSGGREPDCPMAALGLPLARIVEAFALVDELGDEIPDPVGERIHRALCEAEIALRREIAARVPASPEGAALLAAVKASLTDLEDRAAAAGEWTVAATLAKAHPLAPTLQAWFGLGSLDTHTATVGEA